MTFGSLFSGIGGMDLGLERAGWECAWQCENDSYANRVLAKHWPHVRRWDDVRTFPPHADDESESALPLNAKERNRDSSVTGWDVDLICGGFPCQDISFAGKGAGLDGERSGLWYEFARVVRLLRPRFVLVENVSALLNRGLDAVLGTLAADGYDAEWACIPAAAVGAPHIRDRVFIVAYAQGDLFGTNSRGPRSGEGESGRETQGRRICQGMRLTDDGRFMDSGAKKSGEGPDPFGPRLAVGSCFGGNARSGLAAFERVCRGNGGWWTIDPADLPDAKSDRREAEGQRPQTRHVDRSDQLQGRQADWESQSRVGRVAHGIPARMDRLRGLGNAVVPQVAEWLGRRILEASQEPKP